MVPPHSLSREEKLEACYGFVVFSCFVQSSWLCAILLVWKKRFLVSFFDLSLCRGSGYQQHKRIEKESRKRFETTTKNQKVVSFLLRPTRNSKRKQVSSPFGRKNRKCKYPFPSTNPFLFQCSKPLSFSQCSNNSNLLGCWCNGQFSLTWVWVRRQERNKQTSLVIESSYGAGELSLDWPAANQRWRASRMDQLQTRWMAS